MSNIADKIRKLIALADSTTHPEEADTFMGKAQSLMMAHGLSLLDLGRLDSEDPVGTDMNAVEMKASYDWAEKIMFAAARYYGCEAVMFKRKGGYSIALVGRESARVTAALLIPFIIRQASKAAGEGVKSGLFPNRRVAHNHISIALRNRIWRETDVSNKQADGRGLNALVPVDVIQLELEAQFPNSRTARSAKNITSRAAVELASKVSLNLQTGNTANTKRITQ